MLDRHRRGPKHGLQRRDIQPEEGHDQRKQHGREQVVVPGGLVEQRRVLEDGQAASADREEVEPLPVCQSVTISRNVGIGGTYITTSVTK